MRSNPYLTYDQIPKNSLPTPPTPVTFIPTPPSFYPTPAIKSLELALTSPPIPSEILQVLLNLAGFIEHDDKPLSIDIGALSKFAGKCHDELPENLKIHGVPRRSKQDKTVGMKHLALVKKSGERLVFKSLEKLHVDLHKDAVPSRVIGVSGQQASLHTAGSMGEPPSALRAPSLITEGKEGERLQ